MKEEILDKHLGFNAEIGYKPIDRKDIIAAMEEYARAGILEELELHIRLNEDDWCRNPQAQLESFIEERNYTRCSCGGEIKSTNITGEMECEICDKSY